MDVDAPAQPPLQRNISGDISVGLVNDPGDNLCYLNALLMTYAHLVSFRTAITSAATTHERLTKVDAAHCADCVTCQLSLFFRNMDAPQRREELLGSDHTRTEFVLNAYEVRMALESKLKKMHPATAGKRYTAHSQEDAEEAHNDICEAIHYEAQQLQRLAEGEAPAADVSTGPGAMPSGPCDGEAESKAPDSAAGQKNCDEVLQNNCCAAHQCFGFTAVCSALCNSCRERSLGLLIRSFAYRVPFRHLQSAHLSTSSLASSIGKELLGSLSKTHPGAEIKHAATCEDGRAAGASADPFVALLRLLMGDTVHRKWYSGGVPQVLPVVIDFEGIASGTTNHAIDRIFTFFPEKISHLEHFPDLPRSGMTPMMKRVVTQDPTVDVSAGADEDRGREEEWERGLAGLSPINCRTHRCSQYELRGLVCLVGERHYVTIQRSSTLERWKIYDDDKVVHVVSSMAELQVLIKTGKVVQTSELPIGGGLSLLSYKVKSDFAMALRPRMLLYEWHDPRPRAKELLQQFVASVDAPLATAGLQRLRTLLNNRRADMNNDVYDYNLPGYPALVADEAVLNTRFRIKISNEKVRESIWSHEPLKLLLTHLGYTPKPLDAEWIELCKANLEPNLMGYTIRCIDQLLQRLAA